MNYERNRSSRLRGGQPGCRAQRPGQKVATSRVAAHGSSKSMRTRCGPRPTNRGGLSGPPGHAWCGVLTASDLSGVQRLLEQIERLLRLLKLDLQFRESQIADGAGILLMCNVVAVVAD